MNCARRITSGQAASRRKRALQLAFYRGVLTVSRREGMLKTYELMTRHFGWERLPKPASESERNAYLLDRAVRAQGVVSLDSICHLDAPRKAAIRKMIGSRAPQGAGAGRARGREARALGAARTLETAFEPVEDVVHILNPFDPLVIQRKRLELFFGYDHRFEAYVPKDEAPVRLLRAAGAGRRRDRRGARPQDRSRARQAADPEMDLARQGRRAARAGSRSRRRYTASSVFSLAR